jgi:hypothetical protein
MAVEHLPNPITFMFRIKMQHHSRDLAPVRAFRMRIEQAAKLAEGEDLGSNLLHARRGLQRMKVEKVAVHGFCSEARVLFLVGTGPRAAHAGGE